MSIIPDCTLTTACYLLTKYHPHARSLDDTIQSMNTLLTVPCYLVIYCNHELVEHITNVRKKHQLDHLTKVIVKEFEELWTYPFVNQIKQNRETYWPTRDSRVSPESTCIVFNKFNFVLQTIQSNPFSTTTFGWIDGSLGINGMKICEENFTSNLLYSLTHLTPKFHLQMLNVEHKKYREDQYKREYYQQARWVACGCFFTTTSELGIKILTRLQEIVTNTIQLGYGHGEEYFYLDILDEFYDDIYRAYGDYRQILHNWIKPTRNLVYIYWNIIMKNYEYGYYRECSEACHAMIRSFDSFEIETNYDLYVRLYSVMYLSLKKINPPQSEIIGNQIRKYYHTNPYFKHQFNNLRHLCGMDQFTI
jgi:hypothetical protein